MKGIVCIALYGDNNLMVGDIAAIDDVIEALKNEGKVLKIMEKLSFPIIRMEHGWDSPTYSRTWRRNFVGWYMMFGVTKLPVPPRF